jgi:MFS family permease
MSTSDIDVSRAERRHPTLLQNRWLIAAAGTIMMMCLGTVYSWSLYARPLMAAFHWSVMTTMWAFSIAIFALGIGAVVGGRAQDKIGPRAVAIAGVFLWALGNLLAGMFTESIGVWWLYLTYGLIGGFGLGMGYVSPVAMVTCGSPTIAAPPAASWSPASDSARSSTMRSCRGSPASRRRPPTRAASSETTSR